MHQTIRKPNKCKFCAASFNSIYGLFYHTNSAHNNKSDICEKSFKSKDLLSSHISRLHKCNSGLKKYGCESCGKNFPTDFALQGHECMSNTLSSNGGIETGSINEDFKCNICNKTFCSKASLSNHNEHVHEGKRYYCDQCENDFISKARLQEHTYNYHNFTSLPNITETKVQCDFCEKEFSSHKGLDIHCQTTHQEQNNKCATCDKLFGNYSGLKNHLIIHFQPLIQCDLCEKSFKLKSIDSHIDNVHRKRNRKQD